MELVRHSHIFCYWNQYLEESDNMTKIEKKKKKMPSSCLKENDTNQQGSFGQFTLLCTSRDGNDVTFAGDKLLWTDFAIFM